MLDSEVKAALILASSETDEFNTLFNFRAKDLFGLLEMDKEGGESRLAVGVNVLVCSIAIMYVNVKRKISRIKFRVSSALIQNNF
jgi:hypothetical protein